MIGALVHRGFRLDKKSFFALVDSLRKDFRVIGPVREGKHTFFREIRRADELYMEYKTTMEPPSRAVFYRPSQELLQFEFREKVAVREVPPPENKYIILGIHPCDMYAILYLDNVFHTDPYYTNVRENSFLVALNCVSADEFCFCSSVGTGPHFKAEAGPDLLLTDMDTSYLLEIKSKRGEDLLGSSAFLTIEALEAKALAPEEYEYKETQEKTALRTFKKHIALEGLDRLFLNNLEHPVWTQTAEGRCLSCTNCVMVCPTCFCHDVVDETAMDLRSARRLRRWDACQDFAFSKVHGGNFRMRRLARLRQFVTHKLDYTAQFGGVGTVGCGRCIRWCPTGIDLTEIAKEIQRNPIEKLAPAT